jgi:histidinol-phosphate aminotransferase
MTLPRIRPAVLNAPDYDAAYLSDAGVRLRIHRNESALPPPAHVLASVRALDADALRYYPAELLREFTAALAGRIGTSTASLALGSGADEILSALARAFLDPGDTMVTVRPTFGMYAYAAAVAGANLRAVPYEQRWQLDPSAIIRAADARTRLVVLGHPNNPTGDALSAADVRLLAGELPDATIVIDEVYLALSSASLAPLTTTLPNVVVVGSFSKIAALAGMRVGYAIASERIAASLRRVIQAFPLSAASLVAANAYICGGAETVVFETALATQTRRSLDAVVDGVGRFADSVWRGPANFVLMDFGARAPIIEAALTNKGIAARSYAGSELSGCLRFCAADDDATAELITAVQSAMAEETAAANA